MSGLGSTSDDELVARAQRGERPAFDALVVRHRGLVRRMIAARLRDDAQVEELAQRTFVQAFEALATFRGDAAFGTWLTAIARNLVRNDARDRPAQRLVPIDEVELITNALATGKLIAREVRQKLAGAVAELSPKQRRVVELHLLQGLAFRDVAAEVGSSEESARRNYSHALKRLREVLLPDGA